MHWHFHHLIGITHPYAFRIAPLQRARRTGKCGRMSDGQTPTAVAPLVRATVTESPAILSAQQMRGHSWVHFEASWLTIFKALDNSCAMRNDAIRASMS